MGKKRTKRNCRYVDPNQVSSCSHFLTPKQWMERWKMKLQHAIQMAR